ncbi:TadE/TadG family type IV pilus assembly protein [Dietzia cercidiphylli]|uniref:TadE/TadG family type IV pilus assembly protein n=1 Tax=Dietzia cercidiphylli TaxID=498199 RepID=UPI003F81A933
MSSRQRTPRHRGGPHPRATTDAGANTIAVAVLFPLVLLLTFAIWETALFYQARSLATAAAEQGLTAARAQHGNAALGIAAAQQFVATAPPAMNTPVVTGTRTATQASITVSGTAISTLPEWILPPVSVTKSGPVERITQPGETSGVGLGLPGIGG